MAGKGGDNIGVFRDFRDWRTSKQAGQRQIVDLLRLGEVPSEKLSEATYFACIKILSESLGKLPLKLLRNTAENGVEKAVEHPLYSIIKYRPNPYMTASTFWGTVEFNRNHYGNAYCYIHGAGSETTLWVLPSEDIEVWYDDASILSEVPKLWYIYKQVGSGKRYKLSSEEVMHFKSSVSADGIVGLSVQTMLKSSIESNQQAQAMLGKLYENGFTAKAVVQYTGSLSDELTKTFLKGIEAFATGKDKDVKSIIPIPLGATLTPLNIKLTDGQFLELKKYSALQIAAAFGIKPNQINDYEKASYSSAEAQQLSFYVDTLLYILKQYEEEIAYKLLTRQEVASGLHFKFNVSVILRADSKTQIESLAQAVQNSIYTPNEARAYLDLERKEGGDSLLANGNIIPVKLAGAQYATVSEREGGEKS